MIHRDVNPNENETNRDTLDKVIEECSDIKSPAMMEDCENEEIDDSNKKRF